MFPVQLAIYLSDSKLPKEIEALVQSWFPDLRWGQQEDLMKHSDEWPQAVVCVETRSHDDPEGHGEFPTSVDFIVFPRRVTEENARMYPTKLALMRRFAREFECRTACDAQGFASDDDYTRSELFLCQAGRFYSGNLPLYYFRDGMKPQGGWLPLDDVPLSRLDSRGQLVDEEVTIAEHTKWREGRSAPEPYRDPAFGPPTDLNANKPPEHDDDDDFYDSIFGSPIPKKADFESAEEDAESPDPYLKRLAAWEDGAGTTKSKELISRGVELPAPDSLGDDELPEKLWEVIRILAKQNTFIDTTNHLSDRELYEYLWSDALNEYSMDLSGLTGCACHLSLLSGGSDEDTFTHFKYYDGPKERADWMASWPDYEMPAHEDPPYDRDKLLPKAHWPKPEDD
jgi:hypothetical protein